jgi:NTP pyrophosphatase (non-canonical NTP hydrolase)
MTIQELCDKSHEIAVEKGWWGDAAMNGGESEERNFPELLALMHSEISEILEEYRKFGLTKLIYKEEAWSINDIDEKVRCDKPEGIAIEFADLLIRLGDVCKRYNIPIEKALQIKMEYNKTRSYRHGNKKC